MASYQLPEGFEPIIGTDETVLDDKGRVLIPKRKRDRLGRTFALVLGKVGALVIYPEAIWRSLLLEVFEAGTLDPAREQFTRLQLGMAADGLKFDPAGRMVIPQDLRDAAKLNIGDPLKLIGCGDRIEIWTKSEWDAFQRFPQQYGKERREPIEEAYQAMLRAAHLRSEPHA